MMMFFDVKILITLCVELREQYKKNKKQRQFMTPLSSFFLDQEN